MTYDIFSLAVGKAGRLLLLLNTIVAVIYFSWWFNLSHVGNPYLFGLLAAGETYHVGMALLFWLTVWPRKKRPSPKNTADFSPSVVIFIPVANEPVDVVRQTIAAAKRINYENKTIYLLNDGFVAHAPFWKDIEKLAEQEGIACITRQVGGGAKAGNINNALKQTTSDIVVIFDADMLAHPEFLHWVLPFFQDPHIGFVQTPQFYSNASLNEITGGSWEQQEFFFGPVMEGKNRTNSAFLCGTNVAIRRTALEQVGGMEENNIAEDFLTSLFLHQKGWRSEYVTTVLAQGLAPQDLLAYYKQQLRWARGNLDVFFTHNPLLMRGLSFMQRLQYLSSSLFYLNGSIVLIDSLMPLLFLFFGLQPVAATTTSFALFFIPFMFLNLYTLFVVSGGHMTYRAISFSQASFTLQLKALFSVLRRQKMSFAVTPKQQQSGNFIFLVYPHLLYTLLVIAGIVWGVHREGLTSSIITNAAWGLFNVLLFLPFIRAAIQPAHKKIQETAKGYSYKLVP